MSTNTDTTATTPTSGSPSSQVITSANLSTIARQYLDQNVRQYIEANQLNAKHQPPPPTSSTASPSQMTTAATTLPDYDDQLNCELLQLRQHFTMLTSRSGPQSQLQPPLPKAQSNRPTPLPESESLHLGATSTSSNSILTPPNNNTIYAQVKRSPKNAPPRSKYLEFLSTIESYSKSRASLTSTTAPTDGDNNSRTRPYHDSLSNHQHPIIYYHLPTAEADSLVSVDGARRCISISGTSSGDQTPSKTAQKLYAFDHLLTGSLPDKLRTLPSLLLGDLIHSLVQNYIANAVILLLEQSSSVDSTPPPSSGATTINEFAELTHRGLMLHSIAWLFDAIAHRTRASVKISVSALTHEAIYDLVAKKGGSGGYAFEGHSEETEYPCTSAKQATAYLEQAITAVGTWKEEEDEEYLLAMTLHLYQYRIVRLANGKSKVIGSHSKLYIFEAQLKTPSYCSDSVNSCNSNSGSRQQWPPLALMLNSFFTAKQSTLGGSCLLGKSKITQTLAAALLSEPSTMSRRSKRSSSHHIPPPPPPPFGAVSLSVLANLKATSAAENSSEANASQILNICNLVAAIQRTSLLRGVVHNRRADCCTEVGGSGGHRPRARIRCHREASGSCDCGRGKGSSRKMGTSCEGKGYPESNEPNSSTTGNGSAITSSSEQSFDTVIFRGQSMANHRAMLEKLNGFNSSQNNSTSDSSGSKKSSNSRSPSNHDSSSTLLPAYSAENIKESSATNSDDNASEVGAQHRQCHNHHRQHCCRRNSTDSSNHTDSTHTKARLRWWSDRRRHRSSGSSSRKHSTPAEGGHNHSTSNLIYCSSSGGGGDGSIRRLRKKKLKDAVWTEELWVDGPNAICSRAEASANAVTSSPGKSSENGTAPTTSELNELHKKQQRIEQWIQSTFNLKGEATEDNSSSLPPYATIDQTLFWLNNQPQPLESYLPYGDLVLDNRDTLSDCGDKKSDFYDHFHEMWNGGSGGGRNSRRTGKEHPAAANGTWNWGTLTKKTSRKGGGYFYPTAVPVATGEYIDTGETDCTSEPILVVTEPPKQLKLEQFLQQLTKISFPTVLGQMNSSLGGNGKATTTSTNGPSDLVSLPSGSFPVTAVSSASTAIATTATSGIVTSSSGSTSHYQQSSLATTKNEESMNKMKRNTTSTTTSGHGTISEGECSSILGALSKKTTAGVNASSGGGPNSDRTSASVSTPGSGTTSGLASGGTSGAPIQRHQPASSGYESTIQDEDEFLEEENHHHHLGLDFGHGDESATEITVDLGGGNCFGYTRRKKKQRIWTNKLAYLAGQPGGGVGAPLGAQQPSAACLDLGGVTTLILDENLDEECFDQPNMDPGDVCSFFCCSIRKAR